MRRAGEHPRPPQQMEESALRTFTRVALAMSLCLLCACGGGSSGGGGSTTNASVGGIWAGTDPVSGLEIVGLVDEAGEFHFIRSDGAQYVGNASVSGNSVTASYDGYTPLGSAFPDGSTHGTGTLSGTVTERVSISGTTQFMTAAGSSQGGALSLSFNSLYNTPSSLATISGNYTDPSSGDVISINGDGAITWQDPATGCLGNGMISIIDATYNAYRVQFDYANCTGQAAVLNGVQFSGLAALDTTGSPQQAIAGVTGTAGGVTYSVVITLNRS
jgi:hypothetical protein